MKLECDVLVAGGGIAGIGAALAAARLGADTVLVESRAFLGGTAVVAMHGMLCGFYETGPSRPVRPLNDGLATELADRLSRISPCRGPEAVGQVWVLRVGPDALTTVIEQMTVAERRLSIITGARVTSLRVTGGRVEHVVFRTATHDVEVSANAIVDCTGSGAVLALAGVPQEVAPPAMRQCAGFVMRLVGIEESTAEMLPLQVPYALTRAGRQGGLPRHVRLSLFTAGITPGEGFIKLAIPPPVDDERSSAARRDAQLVYEHLQREVPAFRCASIAAMSREAVEREGALMKGAYVLTAADVLGGRRFHDGVVRNAWPIELWDQENGPTYTYLQPGDHYEIPLRCLEAPALTNLSCAGRCISVTREALASTRVTGTCLSLGEAAARAAVDRIRATADRDRNDGYSRFQD